MSDVYLGVTRRTVCPNAIAGGAMKRLAMIGLALILAAASFSCSGKATDSAIPAQRAGVVANPSETPIPQVSFSASAIYVEGFVERGREGSWLTLEIGDSIEADDSIRTGPDGSCEIQFGSSAALRIQPSTLFIVNAIALSSATSQVQGSLAIGTVLNKVSKLSGNDSYTIRTETSVAGVRGTDFVVSTDSVNGTTVSVKSGTVAVIPVSATVFKLLDESEFNPIAAAAVQAIVASASIVEANQQITVAQSDADAADVIYREMELEVASVSAETVTALAKATGTESKGVAAGFPLGTDAVPSALSPGRSRPLIAAGNEIFMSRFNVTGATAPGTSSKIVTGTAGPAETGMTADVEADLAIAQTADVLKRLAARADQGLVRTVPVTMVERSPARESFKILETMMIPEAPVALSPSEEPISMVRTQPEQATPATQTVAPVVPQPKPASPAAQVPKPSSVAATPAKPAAKNDHLVASWQALKGAITGNVVRVDAVEVFVLSDPKGELSGVSAAGKVLWTVTTANRGAEMASAIPFKGIVYYSGSNELVAIDAASGKMLYRTPLEGDRSHILGNRVVPFPDAVVFPTMSGLDVLDANTGEVVRSVPIPGGITMTPANYQGKAVIVNQKGVFMLVDLNTGEIQARIQTGAVQPVALAPRIFGTLACFADRKGLLVMIDLAAMKVAWEKVLPSSGGVFSDVEMGTEGVFAYGKQTIFSYSLDGTELAPPITNVSAPPLLSRGILYYGTTNGALVAVRLSPFAEIGRVTIGSRITARPLFADGFIYVGTGSGKLIKIDPGKISP